MKLFVPELFFESHNVHMRVTEDAACYLSIMRSFRLAAACALFTAALPAADWISLFEDASLEDWIQPNGSAKYEIVDGELVGTTAEGSPNSFFGPKRSYGDFILEFEVLADPRLNSGVQIRSHQYPEETTTWVYNGGRRRERMFPKGRVHGYQVEISNEERASSGGIFDEARRGWIADISADPAASQAFRDNQWNRYRIEAVGDRIRVWVNGTACADLVDPLDLDGFIGFQVHSFRGPKPARIRWRNIRIADLGRHEWQPIFDGESLNGWRSEGGGNAAVENSAIHLTAPKGASAGVLLSDADYDDFSLRLQYKIVSGNSGVFFRRAKERQPSGEPRSYEIEVAPDSAGGLQEPGRRPWIVRPDDAEMQHYYRPGEWNELAISARGGRIVAHVNGVRTVDRKDDPGRRGGRLGLQINARRAAVDVWYKDIELLQPE